MYTYIPLNDLFDNFVKKSEFFFHITGQNILISNDIEDILCYVDQQSEAYTVQKYVEDPLLLQGGRKFDVRFVN